MVIALASHQCSPGSVPGMWYVVCYWFFLCSETFSPGFSGFLLSLNTNINKLQFDPDAGPS